MSNTDIKANRPLSPHLQIYRWPITMTMSILHRVTGIGLYAGTVLLVWWLAAAASGPPAFDFANAVLGSWFGLFVLFCFTWALFHHTLGGIRHFIWDFGVGLDKPARDILAWATLVGSVVLTVIAWAVAMVLR
jgi:succinate dehydrogenase / fumarate reductase, cytochrome b subunit